MNKEKCEYFAINPKNKDRIVFEHGTPLSNTCKATYLGGNLQASGAAKPEIESRIAKAAHIFGRLKPLWKDAACSKAWKLRVFESVVLAILFYGLDSVVLTKALKNRVDYFHTKCLRHILRIQAAYYSKVSNKAIVEKASNILHGAPDKMKLASKTISERAVTLLGHIIRADEQDQMRKIAIDAELNRVERDKRRVGRPRFFWLQTTMHKAYKSHRKKTENVEPPFHKKKKKKRGKHNKKKKKNNEGNGSIK